jgi:hypothetical protein
MSKSTVKEEARRLIERLPEDATWEDVQQAIYVRRKLEAGLRDSQEGRTVPVAEARRQVYALEDLVAQITPENVHEETNWGPARGRESS